MFGGVSSELGVGFMIGVAAMMTQLFFVLMCIFFVLSTEAKTAGYGKCLLLHEEFPVIKLYGKSILISGFPYIIWISLHLDFLTMAYYTLAICCLICVFFMLEYRSQGYRIVT